MADIIKVHKLVKDFKDVVAVNNLSLDIKEGECFGLLGPNGAGKTTLVRMITGVTPCDSGHITVFGENLEKNLREIKAKFGVIPQIDNLDSELTVIHNLETFARYFDIPKKEAHKRSLEILELFKLSHKADKEISSLSGGMRRRLLLARGIINDPKIIVLDEPSVGLDPQAKYLVWQKLKELKDMGITQLLSTQNMDEATVLCDRVAVMYKGSILAMGAPKMLIEHYVGEKILEIGAAPKEKEEIIKVLDKACLSYSSDEHSIQVIKCDADKLGREFKEKYGWNVWQRLATLEDVFLELTGRGLIE